QAPASTSVSAQPETKATTTEAIPGTLIHGNTGNTVSIHLRNNHRTISPAIIGINTIWTMESAMASTSTGIRRPASHNVKIGVKIGASREETEVIVTDRTTSPLDRSVITLDDGPPGAQPTKSTPRASSVGNCKATIRPRAMAGIITYWEITPRSTGRGRLATSAKSGMVRVTPIANMMMPSASDVKLANGAVWSGKKKPIKNAAIMIAGNTVTANRAERSSPDVSGCTGPGCIGC